LDRNVAAFRVIGGTVRLLRIPASGPIALAIDFPPGKETNTVCAMWKPSQSGSVTPNFTPEPVRPAPAVPTSDAARARVLPTAGDQATIGKGMVIKGEITGTESLFIDGKVEGSINLPGNRVTVGQHGQVAASMAVCITAREIVVMGKIHGNVSATDRVEIRAEGALTGDVSAARISIEDGAFFKGGIDIRKSEPGTAAPESRSGEARTASEPRAAIKPEEIKPA